MRYQYTSSGFKRRLNPSPLTLPGGVKFLLIINILVFMLTELSGQKHSIFLSFGLVPNMVWSQLKIWQLLTYMFIHGGGFHLVLNMLFLWIIGKDLEMDWGKKDFLVFYFFCGIGAGIITTLINNNSLVPTVGASGAIYGVLVAFGFAYPNRLVYLYGYFPIRVKYLVIGMGIIAFGASFYSGQSTTSHITHVNGMIIGIIIVYFDLRWSRIKMLYYQQKLKSILLYKTGKNVEKKEMRQRVDEILDKINEDGWESLTKQEEQYLNRASKRLFDDRSPN